MPDDSSGSYTLPPSYKVSNGDVTDAIQHNPPLEDIAQALSARLSADGRKSWTGHQNANGHKVTNLAPATASGDAVRLDQVAGSFASQVHDAAAKTTPVDADELPLLDSEAAFSLRKLTVANLRSAIQTAFESVFAPITAPIRTATASTPITGADAGRTVIVTMASAGAVTIPLNTTTALPAGFWCNVIQGGAGQITFYGESGVTLSYANGRKTRKQYSMVTILKTATNTWMIGGDTEE